MTPKPSSKRTLHSLSRIVFCFLLILLLNCCLVAPPRGVQAWIARGFTRRLPCYVSSWTEWANVAQTDKPTSGAGKAGRRAARS